MFYPFFWSRWVCNFRKEFERFEPQGPASRKTRLVESSADSRHARHEQASNDSVRWMALIPKVKLPRVAFQRSTLQTPNTPKFVKPKDGKRYISMLGVFLTLLDKWGRPQPDKLSIHSRRPLGVHLLPWLYHGNSYWRDRANQNLPKVQERTLRHRSNEHCRAVWRPHWPFMQNI